MEIGIIQTTSNIKKENMLAIIIERHYQSPNMVLMGCIGGVYCIHDCSYHNNKGIWS